MPTFPFPRRFLAFALTTLAALVSAFALMGCTSEKQYPGGDNDDRRKAPAASPSPAASASPTAETSREKPGSGDTGGK